MDAGAGAEDHSDGAHHFELGEQGFVVVGVPEEAEDEVVRLQMSLDAAETADVGEVVAGPW